MKTYTYRADVFALFVFNDSVITANVDYKVCDQTGEIRVFNVDKIKVNGKDTDFDAEWEDALNEEIRKIEKEFQEDENEEQRTNRRGSKNDPEAEDDER